MTTSLPSAPAHTQTDAAGDDPKQARAQIDAALTAIGTMISWATGLFGSNGTAATALATVGAEPADAKIVKADETRALEVGYTATEVDLGTPTAASTVTLDLTAGDFQKLTNNAAFILAPPSGVGSCIVEVTNGANAGAITTTGWTKVKGDPYATTSGQKYLFQAVRTGSYSLLTIVSLN